MGVPSTVSPQPPATPSPPIAADGLLDVSEALNAFIALQGQNARVTNLVAADLHVGTIDVRALILISRLTDVKPKQVADYLELSTGAVTSLIDRMEKAALLTRVPHPTDRRSVILELAPAGFDAVDRIYDFYRRAFRDAVDPHHLDFLAASLRALADSLASTAAHDREP